MSVPGGVERLRLVASAVAGRLVDVAGADPGDAAWTDGATIYVDPELPREQQLGRVVVQACLLGAGSLGPDVVAALARRPALVPRYLAIEGHRALASLVGLLPAAADSLLQPDVARSTESPAASLSVARERRPIAAPPAEFGTIRPRRVRVELTQPPGHDLERHAPRAAGPEPTLRELDDSGSDDAEPQQAADLSSPVGGGGAVGRLLQRLLRAGRSRGSGPPGAEPATHLSRRGRATARRAAATTVTTLLGDEAGLVRPRGVSYPEWDVHRHAYRPDWCTVVEVAADSGDTTLRLTDTHALRRSLARIGLDIERRHRQLQGDDIDIDATVDAWVDVVAGSAPDEAIYVDNVRRRRDLAVLVLLDVSGSAGEPSTTGAPVHEHQRAAAAALTATFHGLGDRVALYAFRSMGRSAVQLTPVKRFDDGVGPPLLRRLGALVPGAYTRIGAAIRHGAAVLESEGGTGRRLLVVLSDGFAYDHGYDGAYGQADARRALAEARRRGTGCVCLSVGAVSDPDELRRVFGTAAHATLPRLEQLPAVVGPLFQAALKSAEQQRRNWQRVHRSQERHQIERKSA